MNLKWILSAFSMTSMLFSNPTENLTERVSDREEKKRRLEEIDSSLASLKKWQGQYLHKQKSFQMKASRVLFKNSTESRQYKEIAEDAKANAQALQDQIDLLISQKDSLLDQE